MTPEQIAGLVKPARYSHVRAEDGYASMMCVRPDGAWVKGADFDTLARHVLTQQAQIERLSNALNRIASMTDLDDPDSYASDTPSDCVEVVHHVANFALKGGDA